MKLSKIQGADGSEIWIQYDEDENEDLRAVGFVDDIAERTEKFNKALTGIIQNYSSVVIEAVKKGLTEVADPESVELEFGIQLGGETGIPFVTKGSAQANVKVSVAWKLK